MVEKGKLNEPGPVAVVRPGAGFTQGWDPSLSLHTLALVVSKCFNLDSDAWVFCHQTEGQQCCVSELTF